MNSASQMLRGLEFAFHERFIDGHLGCDVAELTSLPGLHLLAHRLKVPLHPVHSDRDAINQ